MLQKLFPHLLILKEKFLKFRTGMYLKLILKLRYDIHAELYKFSSNCFVIGTGLKGFANPTETWEKTTICYSFENVSVSFSGKIFFSCRYINIALIIPVLNLITLFSIFICPKYSEL